MKFVDEIRKITENADGICAHELEMRKYLKPRLTHAACQKNNMLVLQRQEASNHWTCRFWSEIHKWLVKEGFKVSVGSFGEGEINNVYVITW